MPTPRKKATQAAPDSSPAVPEADELPYHLKYRPRRLKDVWGQDEAVRSIAAAIAAVARQHTYFLFGPGGTGKTTLARIMAAELGCQSVVEVDAASNTGIDDMRRVMEAMRFAGFGESPGRAYLIDECHRLSAQAFDSLLKVTEEAPPHVYFFFCSTNPTKIPAAMLTRGPVFKLRPLPRDDIMDLLEYVAKEEGFLPGVDGVLDLVADSCGGSARQALVQLAMVATCESRADAERLLERTGEDKQVIDLCRRMLRGEMRWGDVQAALAPLEGQDPEGIRIQVTLYLAKVLMGEVRDAGRLLDMMASFSGGPWPATDRLAPVMLAFGRFAAL